MIKKLLLVILICLMLDASISSTSFAFGREDERLAISSFSALDRGKLSLVKKSLDNFNDPLIKKYLFWALLGKPNNLVTFAEISDFLKKNPNWPGRNNLIIRAEEKMDSNISPDEALRWFKLFKPISTAGRTKHAIALLDSGAKVQAKRLIRHIWIQDNFPKHSEKAFYRRFRVFLTKSDHIARLDRLLWDGKYWPSKRMIYKVPESWRKLAIARYSLRKKTGNVDTLIKNVPTSLRKNPGLAYERLRWRRQKKLNSASDILKNMPEKSIRPRLWWRERSILARRTLRKGFINEALTFISEHDLIRGVEFANAEWMAGWIRLRFLGDTKAAMRHFKKMFLSVRYPISKARGAYWVARAAENMGEIEISKYWYKRAAVYKTSFYGQLAAEKFSSTNILSFKQVPELPLSVENKFNSQELVKVVNMLNRLRHNELIYPFINQLYSISKSLEEKVLVTNLAIKSFRPDLGIKISKIANREGFVLLKAGYPVIDLPKVQYLGQTLELEKALVLAVIRQESAFRQKAVSSARALGLMQLMPMTAKTMSKKIKLVYSKEKLLRSKSYNLMLGQMYLSTVLKKYDHSYVLALAAYNAGPRRVQKWIAEFGDPRDDDVDVIDWIEMLPIYETRNYIQRVLESLQVYRYLLAGEPTIINLSYDLSVR